MELQEPEKIVLQCDGTKRTTGQGLYEYTYYITSSSAEETEMILKGEIKGLSGMAKFFGKLMAGTFKKACAKDLDALKAYLKKQ